MRPLVILSSVVLFLSGPLGHASPGPTSSISSYAPIDEDDYTSISIRGRNDPDDKVYFSGPAITMSVTVAWCEGGGAPCMPVTASITVASGDKSRKEMAAALGTELQEQLPDADIDISDTSITVNDTPSENPANGGTPDNPLTSPNPPDSNKPFAEWSTTGL